jgi:hypothetical protein
MPLQVCQCQRGFFKGSSLWFLGLVKAAAMFLAGSIYGLASLCQEELSMAGDEFWAAHER